MPIAASYPLEEPSKTRPTDEELLLRYRDCRDLEAFRDIVHRYDKPIFNYLLHRMRSAPLAEEVFQETFLRVHEKCRDFDPSRQFRPWLYGIATHLAIDALRKEKRHRAARLDQERDQQDGHAGALRDLVVSRIPSPPQQIEALEQAQQVWKAIDTLPDDLRGLILLIYFQGIKFREAAEVLKLPLGTVKSRIHKALKIMRNCRRA
jgi:RNA polymerase sigma-70 factor, ECF subfamily